MTNAKWPFVTIVIVNRNYGQWVGGAIESALKQDYPTERLDIQVVDDCSDDNSVEVISEFTNKEDSRVTLTQIPKSFGPSKARNIAISNSLPYTNVYVILDADDEMYPNKVKRLVLEWLQAPNQIGVVYGDYDTLNIETGVKIREYKPYYDKNRLNKECIVHSGALISSAALLSVREDESFYDESMRTCEDYDLWMRISEKFMIMHVAEPLTLVRVHSKNSTNSVPSETWNQNYTRVFEKARIRNARK